MVDVFVVLVLDCNNSLKVNILSLTLEFRILISRLYFLFTSESQERNCKTFWSPSPSVLRDLAGCLHKHSVARNSACRFYCCCWFVSIWRLTEQWVLQVNDNVLKPKWRELTHLKRLLISLWSILVMISLHLLQTIKARKRRKQILRFQRPIITDGTRYALRWPFWKQISLFCWMRSSESQQYVLFCTHSCRDDVAPILVGSLARRPLSAWFKQRMDCISLLVFISSVWWI